LKTTLIRSSHREMGIIVKRKKNRPERWRYIAVRHLLRELAGRRTKLDRPPDTLVRSFGAFFPATSIHDNLQ